MKRSTILSAWSPLLVSFLTTASNFSRSGASWLTPCRPPSLQPSRRTPSSIKNAITMRTSMTTSNTGSGSTSKSLSAPTIANRASHERILDRFEGLGLGDRMKLTKDEMPRALQQYAADHSLRPTKEESHLLKEVEGMPRAMMAGAPDEANFLCLLLELLDAETVVEVGVFRGLTTLSLALCLRGLEERSDGSSSNKEGRKVIGLDVSEEYAAVGREYWRKAGVEDRIDFRIGDAKDSLTKLLEERGENSADLCFIDADKASYDDYYEKCLALTRPGGLIVVDNTLWGSGGPFLV